MIGSAVRDGDAGCGRRRGGGLLSQACVHQAGKSFVRSTMRSTCRSERDERRKFIPRHVVAVDYAEKNAHRPMADLLVGKVPGVRTIGGGSSQIPASTRGGSRCAITVVMNGFCLPSL